MAVITYKNIDTCSSYKKLLKAKPTDLRNGLTPERIAECSIPAGGNLTYNYAARCVSDEIVDLLTQLAEDQQLTLKYRALLSGETINTGENRMVLHHLTRGQLEGDVVVDGKNLRNFYRAQQERIYTFVEAVASGEIKGSTGKTFTHVVQIGIGGSDLGPRALYIALEGYAKARGKGPLLEGHFISNVDPDDPSGVLEDLDLERTLFILVSKSGTTQETLTNRDFVIEKMAKSGIRGLAPESHIVSVTSETSPLATKSSYLDSFYIDDFIGGRYSSMSAVGGVILSLAFGKEVFEELLEGANEADRNALNEHPMKNASLMDALIGVYERNVLGYPSTAILPYSQALARFPAHLQQLDMESNGKSVNRDGNPVAYDTGPVIFGEPGTNGQHSFYQLLHQGTDVVPLQFIGFKNSQRSDDTVVDGSSSQMKLLANLTAQIVAFAKGKQDPNPNKNFAGGRPSSLLYANSLTPEALGALLAHYENKVMFQGFLWNVNSFDQEGVQLGKVLAKGILDGTSADPALDAYMKLLS